MNKHHTEFHLKEAFEQLQETLSSFSIKTDDVELELEMEHLYHHLNTAWNARNATEQETTECNKNNFNKWRQFPKDIDLSC
jgi:hypothetical protein